MKLESGQFFGDTLGRQQAPGVQMSVTRYSAGSVLPAHSHRYAYFCLIRSGAYEESYDSGDRLCRQGLVVFHPAEEKHCQRMGSQAVISFNVELDVRWTERTMFHESWSAAEGPLAWLANSLYREFKTSDNVTPLAVEAILLEMAVASVRNKEDMKPQWISRTREILGERFQERLSVRELAIEAGVHPAHLARTFRQHYRCSPGEYLRHLRVEAARQLLETSADSVATIAASCGFSDQSHLTRLFSRHFGVTPSAYRRQVS
jgi:AraC family transcriptional regulator